MHELPGFGDLGPTDGIWPQADRWPDYEPDRDQDEYEEQPETEVE